jgi:ankyrin repeat protein
MELHEAAEEGDLTTLRALLQAHPERVNDRSELGDTPLHCAAYQKQDKAVKLLLDAGADLDARGDHGRTPLHCAAVAGAVETARLLIQRGADLEAVDERDQTPLLAAVNHVEVGRPETQKLVKLLLKSGAHYDLESAVVQQDAKRVQEILSTDPDTLRKLPKEKQAVLIHMAVHDPTVMKLLLQHGVDPNARTKKGAFASPPITRVTDPIVAEVLLQHGADPNAKNAEGRTRLQDAKKYKEAELEQVFVRFGGKSRPAGGERVNSRSS